MGFKEIIQKMGDKKRERKELLKRMVEQDKLENLVMERKKSSNLRELELHIKEEREKQIKEQLDVMRKRRQKDISFNHNPLNVKNITSKTDWEVLKERNMFKKNRNMFENQEFIHKNNPNLLKSGNLFNNHSMFSKGGGLI